MAIYLRKDDGKTDLVQKFDVFKFLSAERFLKSRTEGYNELKDCYCGPGKQRVHISYEEVRLVEPQKEVLEGIIRILHPNYRCDLHNISEKKVFYPLPSADPALVH